MNVTILLAVRVLPLHAQVALLDATWHDYPQWEGDEAVAFKAASLTTPDSPPYPGFAVATRPDSTDGELSKVCVEVWADERPADMRIIHQSTLYVGRAGVEVGNIESETTHLDLPTGQWPLEIWVDSDDQAAVERVVFVIWTVRSM